MSRRLLVLGCGGHGRVVADAALERGYEEVAFLDDSGAGRTPEGLAVLGPVSAAKSFAAAWPAAIVGIGDPTIRLRLFEIICDLGFETPTIIHPTAVVSRHAVLGAGVFLAAGAIVNVGARIGKAVIVNTGARIDHDCVIGAGAHIAPGATLSGNVTVGDTSWLGAGCSVRQRIVIGADVTVGVGAAVVVDLPEAGIYAGVPARSLKTANR